MSGLVRPLSCCDRDCAGANGCRVGGYQFDRCGLWFCGDCVPYAGERTPGAMLLKAAEMKEREDNR